MLIINKLEGEITLSAFDSCRLMALNLFSYVTKPFTKEAKLNFELLSEHSYKAQYLMDDLIELEVEKLDGILNKIQNDSMPDEDKQFELELWSKIKSVAQNGRRTGLGFTSLGDCLAALGFTYGTKEATEMAVQIQKCITQNSYRASIDMAEERGSFPEYNYEYEKNNAFLNKVIVSLGEDYIKKYKTYGRRNIANLTIAPTGTVSLLSQTTSGIEPCFMPAYVRRVRTEDKSQAKHIDVNGVMFTETPVVHHKLKLWYDINYPEGKDIMSMTEQELKEIVALSPYHKATSNDVDWKEKVRMQGAIQQFIDHSINILVAYLSN